MRALFVVVSVATLSAVACKDPPKEEPSTKTALAAPTASASNASNASSAVASAANAMASASPSAKAAHPEECEVEIFGTVTLPKDAPKGQKAIVYVAQNDCLADDAKILGHQAAGDDGKFMIEVFPKWGTDITICAALDAGEGKPAVHYAKAAGKFHAEAVGEVTFNEVKLDLAKGKPHAFPKDASDITPAKAPTGDGGGAPK